MTANSTTIESEYFFDTYALVEVLKGSRHYRPYRDAGIRLTLLNLHELYRYMLRRGIPGAGEYVRRFRPVEFTLDDVLGAAGFQVARERELHPRERGISMADAVGYVVARRLGVRFLTGEGKFRGLENVEFVE